MTKKQDSVGLYPRKLQYDDKYAAAARRIVEGTALPDSGERFSTIELDEKAPEPTEATPQPTKATVTSVTYSALRITSKFENDRVEMVAVVEEGQNALSVAAELRRLCELALKRD